MLEWRDFKGLKIRFQAFFVHTFAETNQISCYGKKENSESRS